MFELFTRNRRPLAGGVRRLVHVAAFTSAFAVASGDLWATIAVFAISFWFASVVTLVAVTHD